MKKIMGVCKECGEIREFKMIVNTNHLYSIIDLEAVPVKCKECGWKWWKKMSRVEIKKIKELKC